MEYVNKYGRLNESWLKITTVKSVIAVAGAITFGIMTLAIMGFIFCDTQRNNTERNDTVQ